MTKKKSSSNFSTEMRAQFMFPFLHQDIVANIPSHITPKWVRRSHNDSRSAMQTYPTNVMGKFRCKNDACKTDGWSSKHVALLIRGYAGNGYNAVVFNQRCKSCDTLGIFDLDKTSYIERVSYRIQKWAGIEVEQPYYAPKEGPPHRQELCEGCKRGVCRQTNN
jgi:hypothetical protein